MAQSAQQQSDDAIAISMYEYYTMAIHSLLARSPWEIERQISQYHRNFLAEQRCLALSILLLMSEEYVPESALAGALPKAREQTRGSLNRAVFLRALEHQFRTSPHAKAFAQATFEKMGSYVQASRSADEQKSDPLIAMTETLSRRVPPKDAQERQLYEERIGKILAYVEGIVGFLAKKYDVVAI